MAAFKRTVIVNNRFNWNFRFREKKYSVGEHKTEEPDSKWKMMFPKENKKDVPASRYAFPNEDDDQEVREPKTSAYASTSYQSTKYENAKSQPMPPLPPAGPPILDKFGNFRRAEEISDKPPEPPLHSRSRSHRFVIFYYFIWIQFKGLSDFWQFNWIFVVADTQEATAVVCPDHEVGLVVDHGPEAIDHGLEAIVVDLVRSMIDAIDVWAITIGHDSLTIVSVIVSIHCTMDSLSF